MGDIKEDTFLKNSGTPGKPTGSPAGCPVIS
jgi:hypothetical protein